MWRMRVVSCAAAGLLLGASPRAGDRAYVFSAVDVPGATLTQAVGINPAGEIVGSYRDAAGKQHGFVLTADGYTSIDFPGAISTDARGISPDGDIVGTFRLAGEPPVNVHGYLLTKHGEFLRVDFPGHTSAIPQRILPDGTILGCYHDADTMSTMHGMSVGPHGATEIDISASMHNGATPNGNKIAGLYTDMMTGRARGYVLDGPNFIPFDVPGSTATQAWDMNPSADIVGVYRDGANKFHGFVVDEDWQFETIDVPGASATRAFGINPRGDIAGFFVDAKGTHGFVGRRAGSHER